MSQKIMRYIIILSALVLTATVTLSAILWREEPNVPQHFSEKVNLALRQTAHRLLKKAGDSTSTISPIQEISPNTFLVKLEHHFNYDSLPVLLNNSFNTFDIKTKYDVAVWDCSNKELILGYSSFDFSQGSDITCGGRNQTVQCFNFTVMFPDMTPKPLYSTALWLGLSGFTIAIFWGMGYFFNSSPNKKSLDESFIHAVTATESYCIHIGQTIFDTRNQTVTIGDSQQKLTFREAKLLQLFCNHTNELLEREDILKAVWEDEGVLVGRSVDVFVSRLRKILKNDDMLKITNVHSRGYRLDVIPKIGS